MEPRYQKSKQQRGSAQSFEAGTCGRGGYGPCASYGGGKARRLLYGHVRRSYGAAFAQCDVRIAKARCFFHGECGELDVSQAGRTLWRGEARLYP